uniref:Uncharacterized protein n=1 Tax=Candidatus Kentrum sp. LPFa TaxID=2126335 RepID=A0A450W1J6_9GAMM|nr:MAG: hypothetical protein BECKLPF1236B_GA0070989_10184 [Candidatus Kentron sp. LPFa]
MSDSPGNRGGYRCIRCPACGAFASGRVAPAISPRALAIRRRATDDGFPAMDRTLPVTDSRPVAMAWYLPATAISLVSTDIHRGAMDICLVSMDNRLPSVAFSLMATDGTPWRDFASDQ